MTIEEKRAIVKAHCKNSKDCRNCVLAGKNDCSIIIDSATEKELDHAIAKINGGDSVNHPKHYTDGKIEVIEYIEDKKLGFCLGNAVKYISRAGKKDPDKEVEDLEKAIWYLERRITEIKEGG